MAGCPVTAPTLARTRAEKLALVDRLLPTVVEGIQHEDNLSLLNEIRRLEAQPPSYLSLRLRAIVRAEMTRRVAKAVG